MVTESLAESFTFKGRWWIPGKAKHKVYGEVSYSPHDGILFSPIGSLRDDRDTPIVSASHIKIPVVIGETQDGKLCTLIHLIEVSYNRHTPGTIISTYEAMFLAVGRHYRQTKDVTFKSINASFNFLQEWTGVKQIETENNFKYYRATCHHQNAQHWNIPTEGINITLQESLEVSHNPHKHLYAEYIPSIDISSKTSLGISKLFSICRKFSDLLTLVVGEQVLCLKIVAYHSNSKKRNETPTVVNIYFKHSQMTLKKEIHPYRMLIPFKEISSSFSQIINNFFSKHLSISPVLNLYLGTIYNINTPIHFQFLSLINAIECLHRNTPGGRYLNDDEYNAVFNKLTSAIPPSLDKSFKDSLTSKLKYGNEYSLTKRLIDMLNKIDKDFVNKLIHKQSVFVNTVVSTRNYYTHYDSSATNVMQGKKLYKSTKILKAMLLMLIYKEIGIPEAIASEAIIRKLKTEDITFFIEG